MAKAYASDEDQDEATFDDSDEAPELITSREDFENLMDDFLDKYEILGRKMKPILAGESGIEKLETLRRAMGQDERVRTHDRSDQSDLEDEILMPFDIDDRKDRWDCETILSECDLLYPAFILKTQSYILKLGEPPSSYSCSRSSIY